MNSAIGFRRFKTSRHHNQIYITTITSLIGDHTPTKYDITLKNLVSGEYTVFYLNPDGTRHNIGRVAINIPAR